MANEIIEMEISRALTTLKSWDAQIAAYYGQPGLMFFGIVAGTAKKSMIAGYDTEALGKKIQAGVNGIEELIRKRFLLKAAIVKSNHETKVTVNGTEMSVAEAVVFKGLLPQKKALLQSLRTAFTAAQRALNDAQEKEAKRINDLITASLTTDMTDETRRVKASDIRAEQVADVGPELFDPAGVREKIDKLDEEIKFVETELDFVLSNSNVLTKVSVQY